ncbi:retinol dehydrogenase 13-like isoform X2 [Anneissia japonica]|uniref:retinol dehydrogenase 13-like isoform X2 n=1 Tax=Anneissia japonica TaxID=1529436 RepID=UPI0014256ED2|nr:retinol dehydrogenase 13-like isoform X2 [Anneissia japonica]
MSSVAYILLFSSAAITGSMVLAWVYQRVRSLMIRCPSKRNMKGKTVIITGASSGIGKETARDLASRGAKVILACRSVRKGQAAANDIRATTKSEEVYVKHLDVSSLSSVRKFVDETTQEESRLDVLINNAGISAPNEQVITEEGLEITFATNHLGHFLLTNLLLDLLKKSAPSRVVVVAATAYRFGEASEFEFMSGYPNVAEYAPLGAMYCHSKLANVMFTLELAKRLEGAGVTVNCLHPGIVNSEFYQKSSKYLQNFGSLSWLFFKSTTEGAQTSIYLAVSEEVDDVTGKFFSNCREEKLEKQALDAYDAKELWEMSEKLTSL